jgi:hypothetical protein
VYTRELTDWIGRTSALLSTDLGQDENLGVEITGGGGQEVVWANAGDTWAMGVGVWAFGR